MNFLGTAAARLPAIAAALLLALPAALLLAPPAARAGTAYVSDELVLGVFAEQNGQGQRLATLHSGASVETLAVNGEFTQVRLSDGIAGWVKSAYLTTQEPATVRVKQLQEELDRSRATTPALAEAAARSELEQLKGELKDKQAELESHRARTWCLRRQVRPIARGQSGDGRAAARRRPARRHRQASWRPFRRLRRHTAGWGLSPCGGAGMRFLAGIQRHPGAARQA